jgi:hypothetical protein
MHAEQRGILYKNLDRHLQKGYRQGKDKLKQDKDRDKTLRNVNRERGEIGTEGNGRRIDRIAKRRKKT